MLRPIRSTALIAIALALSATGCDKPQTISKFCASATATLATAAPVFDDMKLSCLREIDSRTPFGTFRPPAHDDANCNAIGEKAEGAEAAVKILSEYFASINALASFGTAKAGADAGTLSTKTSAAVGANASAQTAIGSLASFLVSAATSGYQQKQLDKDLPAASKNIASVITALATILREDYIKRQLAQEEEKLIDRYREAAMGASLEAKLTLDTRWTADEQSLAAKRASAEQLATALETIAEGTEDLATHANRLSAKDASALLDPYVSQLQTLIPQIQKGF